VNIYSHIIETNAINEIKINMEKESTYKFLQNIPIGEDLFEGKSQEKIACVVSENIENGEFQIIGIDGGWGTGKSNLVKIVENKLLQGNNNYKFFIYDVWGHQGDDQRKAILVELTDFITEEKLVKDTNKWKIKLDKLLAKEREITTLNLPYLSVGFIFSLLSIIYIPTVNVFKDSMSNFLGIERFIWKFLLITFPICIVFGIYILNVIKQWIKVGFLKSFKLSAQETFQVYTNRQKEETKIETISEKEPSVRDFRNWMKDIDTDLKGYKKRLVIVFDNFDRLPKKNIQSIWSSIHIFFSEEKYSNIKVIIPFDRAHIRNAFSELNSSANDNLKIDFANDYINKTFDIVFRISPPIMSAWKDFFRKCWNEAFKNKVNEEEYLRVEQIYEAHSKSITPREIIAFINEIISIKLIHKNIPEQFIGLFVVNKDEILLDPLKAITETKFLNGLDYLYKDSDDFQKYITALSYQIDSENALEVIYKKQLKDSLRNNDTEKFNEISKTNIFSRIIFSVITEIEDYENPIITLKALNENTNIASPLKQALWDNIYLKYQMNVRENFEVTEGEHTLLIQISSKFKEEWLKKIIKSLENNTDITSTIRYVHVIDKLHNTIKEKSFPIDIYKLLSPKSVSPSNFLDLVREKKELYKNYKISPIQIELDNYLSLQNNDFFEDISHLNYLNSDFTFNQFVISIKEKINANKSNTTILTSLFNALKIVSKQNRPQIGILLSDVEIYTLSTQLNQEQEFYYDIIAMRLARGSEFHPNYRSSFSSVLDMKDDNIVQKVSERIEFYIIYGDFVLNSVKFSNPLTKSIVRQITENQNPNSSAYVNKMILSFHEICDINNLDPQIFIANLTRWKSPTFNKEYIESLSCYYVKEISKNNSRLAKDTVNELVSYFDNLSQDEWKSIFNNLSGDLYQISLIIKYSSWSSYALEALKEVLLNLSQSGSYDEVEKLTRLILDFENANKDLTNTFKNIRDEFINSRNINTNLFSFFGNWLFKYATLEERASDVMRTIMIVSLLDNETCLMHIINNQARMKLLIETADSKSTADFVDGLRDRFDNDKIKQLSKELGIRKKKVKEEVEEEEIKVKS